MTKKCSLHNPSLPNELNTDNVHTQDNPRQVTPRIKTHKTHEVHTLLMLAFTFLDLEWAFPTVHISAVWFVPMKKIFHYMFLDMDEYLII